MLRNGRKVFKRLYHLAKLHIASLKIDNSYAGEYRHLKTLADNLHLYSGFIVDIAASDGVSQSCTIGFYKDPQWKGLAVEMDPEKFASLAFIYANFPGARLARGRVTPHNVKAQLEGFEVPKDFTLLNLDIDSYDLSVIDNILHSGYQPKIISMEVNEKIPPPIYFSVEYDDDHFWNGDHFYGCSLSAATEVVKPYGYKLESLQCNNAIFVRTEICGELIQDLDDYSAYNKGYKDKQDRKTLFHYNSNVDCALNYSADECIAFFNDFFKKYKGKYTLRFQR